MNKEINWSEELINTFGNYLSEDLSGKWVAAKDLLKQGDQIKGRIIAKAPFGIWVDIGIGFPALLEVIVAKDLDYSIYDDDAVYPSGASIDVKVSGVRDHKRQVYLHQKDWPFKINDTLGKT